MMTIGPILRGPRTARGSGARAALLPLAVLLLGAANPEHRQVDPQTPPDPGRPLVVGMDEAFPPHQFLDENGEPAGFDVELLRALAEDQQIEVRFQPGPWHEIRAALERAEIDLAMSVVRTPEREPLLDFSIPVTLAPYVAFVREGLRVRSLADLDGRRVAVERASLWDDQLRSEHPRAQRVPVDQPVEALRAVAEGRADAAILLQTQGLYFVRELGLEDVRSAGAALDRRSYRFAVPEGREDLLALLNDGLHQLHKDGTFDRVWDAWFGVMKPSPAIDRNLARVLSGAGLLMVSLLLAFWLWSRTLEQRVRVRTRDLHETEAENRLLQRRLLQGQKLEALGRFAGGIAHDFNNLLTTVIGNATLAASALPEDHGARDQLDAILRASNAGGRLTRDLLAFGRREPGKPRAVSWHRLLNESDDLVRRLVGSRVGLRFDVSPEAWSVWIDSTQALQILMNLVSNANDAIVGAGSIRIEVANETGDPERVRLTVEDDGVGMDEATRERLFEPFFTTKGERGTGLGLPIVHGIVQRRGGEVIVESEPGRGTAVHVYLPRADDVAGLKSAPRPARPRAGHVVLLVEFDAEVRRTGLALLHSLGHRVTSVATGEEALAQAKQAEIGVVITDAELPGFPGLELARALLEHRPDLRVLLSTETSERLDLEGDLRIGHLPKPYTRDSLEAALRASFAPES
jgi:polar amino acid transport system substrate-binding protein